MDTGISIYSRSKNIYNQNLSRLEKRQLTISQQCDPGIEWLFSLTGAMDKEMKEEDDFEPF
ncbi:MAG: hypothetical protein ACOX3Q_03260 [Clostridia bacterium]|jgi:hypothetical protein